MHHPVVCCRVRPPPTGTAEGNVVAVSNKDGQRSVMVDKQISFDLDHVFDTAVTQEQVSVQSHMFLCWFLD